MSEEILSVENLTVYHLIEETKNLRRAVDNVSFTVYAGEILGITGRSGSGKTTLANALMGTVTSYPGVINLALSFDGKQIVEPRTEGERQFNSRAFRKWQQNQYQKPIETLRGKGISAILQQPRDTLNPNLQTWEQIAECLKDQQYDGDQIKEQVKAYLKAVKLKPEAVFEKFPHQLSIGM